MAVFTHSISAIRPPSPHGRCPARTPNITGNMLGNQIVIGSGPPAKTFVKGGPLALHVEAVGVGPVSYQWYHGGTLIPGATDFSYTVASASSSDAGNYTATVTGPNNTVTTSATPVTIIDLSSGPGASRLINISTRSSVQTGSNITIAGFVITGSQPKSVLVRANGPALLPNGISNYLKDPTLSIYSGSTSTYQNTGWNADPAIAAAALRVGDNLGPPALRIPRYSLVCSPVNTPPW